MHTAVFEHLLIEFVYDIMLHCGREPHPKHKRLRYCMACLSRRTMQ